MTRSTVLRRSVNTERALASQRPRLRGRSHLLAAVLCVLGLPLWVLVSPPTTRLAVAIFGVGITTMLTLSALLHLRAWDGATYERLFRLDHSGIYAAIAGTGIAVGLLGFPPWAGRVLVIGALSGTLIGVVVEWLPFAPPRGFSNTVYLTLGWLPVVLLPWFWIESGVVAVALLILGGALYTVGAVIVAVQRPDPWPAWFGYHEIWHLLVLLAAGVHGVLIAMLAATT